MTPHSKNMAKGVARAVLGCPWWPLCGPFYKQKTDNTQVVKTPWQYLGLKSIALLKSPLFWNLYCFTAHWKNVTSSETKCGCQHDNLVSSLCLAPCNPPLKNRGYAPMADTKTQENNNYNCGLTLHRQPNRLFPKNHFHFSCIVFLSLFFLFSTRHPAFKSQEHRFPTIYFKPVSWITFCLLLSILTKTYHFSAAVTEKHASCLSLLENILV